MATATPQSRHSNGQFAGSLFGRTAPRSAPSIPRLSAAAQWRQTRDLQTVAFAANVLQISADKIILGDKEGEILANGVELRVFFQKKVPTDWGYSNGVRPHYVLSLRRRGHFQKDLTPAEIQELRSQL